MERIWGTIGAISFNAREGLVTFPTTPPILEALRASMKSFNAREGLVTFPTRRVGLKT